MVKRAMKIEGTKPPVSEGSRLGMLLDETAQRDAIHVAIAPVVAAHTLRPGEYVGLLALAAGLLRVGRLPELRAGDGRDRRRRRRVGRSRLSALRRVRRARGDPAGVLDACRGRARAGGGAEADTVLVLVLK